MKAATAEVLLEPESTRMSTTTPSPQDGNAPKRQPVYVVILHNDDENGFDFVIGVLCKIFRYDSVKAYRLTQQAHVAGRSAVWSGSLEVAELKADQIRSCGPDPDAPSALPLRTSVEQLPQ